MDVFSELKVAFAENLASDPGTEVAQGRFYHNTTEKSIKFYDGTSWRTVGGAGGGAGAQWNAPDGEAPIQEEENGDRVYKYEPAGNTDQRLVLFLKVPQLYVAGSQINCYIGQYSPAASGTQLLVASTYLIRKNTDAISSVTNLHSSTNTAITNTVANQYREVALDLTDSSGEINSVAVSAGDLLRIELRRGTDTDTEEVRFVPSATEPSFA